MEQGKIYCIANDVATVLLKREENDVPVYSWLSKDFVRKFVADTIEILDFLDKIK